MRKLKPVLAVGSALALLVSCGEPEVILTGERLDLRADLSAPTDDTAGDAADASRAIGLPAPRVNAGWTQKAGGPDHDSGHLALGATPRRIWSAPIGEGNDRRHRIGADPVVADGRIFAVDSRARVTAHGLNGAPIWSVDLTPPADDPGDASGAGLAVAGSTLFVTTGFGDLVALDAATGREIWTQELDASPTGAPTVIDGLVYVASRDATGWAVDAGNGRVRWTLSALPSPVGVAGGAAPAVNDRLAVFPFASGELAGALREGGTKIWTGNVAGTRPGKVYARITDISGDPVIAGDRVYAGSASGRIAAFDLAGGTQVWSATEGAVSPVVVAGGSVFAVTDLGELVRLDAETGARVWGTPLPYYVRPQARKRQAVVGNFGPVLAGGRLWVASGDGQLRAFSPETGLLVSSVDMPGGAASNPVVAGQTLYVVTQDGQLHAFR
ncbi:PQQ-binding-like beta-propeller repeat protein [Oceaniglobus roseus]|uniref:outer membrane protein assembly factor BamB family protein n=1 Tax=Oceaniglobus roseus TaxID=1737570 RepID=UPI000C7EA564|nr:PQQ-binding-like beta-propeller repeat protein [Kandeliimicrobium roseum]